jgi:hypothetical protein
MHALPKSFVNDAECLLGRGFLPAFAAAFVGGPNKQKTPNDLCTYRIYTEYYDSVLMVGLYLEQIKYTFALSTLLITGYQQYLILRNKQVANLVLQDVYLITCC